MALNRSSENLLNEVKNILTQFESVESVVGGDIDTTFWRPPIQPSSSEINHYNSNLLAFEALWENLRTEFPDYIKREFLGKSSNGQNDVNMYIFEPDNYEKTITVTANVHGGETTGQKILYRFMYHICHDYDKYTQLNYARNKIKFVIIPIANPDGLIAGTRQNANGVDINRNMNWRWDKYVNAGEATKGSSPLSEIESQYINNMLQRFSNEGATAHVDIHNTAPITQVANTISFYTPSPMLGKSARNFVHDVINSISPKGYQINKNLIPNNAPTIDCQADHIHDMHSITVEWQPGAKYGEVAGSNEDITTGLMYIANVILKIMRQPNQKVTEVKQQWGIEIAQNISKTVPFNSNFVDIPDINYTFSPKVDGLLMVTAELSYTNADTSSLDRFVLKPVQTGNPIINPSVLQEAVFDTYSESGGRRTLVFLNRVVPIKAKDTNYSDVTVLIRCKPTAGQILVSRSRLHLIFIPTDIGDNYRQLTSDSSGKIGQTYPVL